MMTTMTRHEKSLWTRHEAFAAASDRLITLLEAQERADAQAHSEQYLTPGGDRPPIGLSVTLAGQIPPAGCCSRPSSAGESRGSTTPAISHAGSWLSPTSALIWSC